MYRALSGPSPTSPSVRRNAPKQDGGEPSPQPEMIYSSKPPIAAAIRTALCALLILMGWALRATPASTTAFLGAYVAGGIGPCAMMFAALRRRQLSVDLLMILAAVGAAYLGDWAEGAILLFLFTLSGALETYAFYRTHHSIESLVQLRPLEALRVRGGEEVRVAIAYLQPGDLVRVRPGERIPVDGEIIEGETSVDEATLTGESRPVGKAEGSPVFAGTLNGSGSVLVRMTRAVADTTLERIIRMVREAQTEKTPTQRFVESWQQPYVFCVLAGSLLAFLAARLIHTLDWNDAFYHAMVLLVVASPCAVVIGSPAVVLSAIARAARHGVLFKGGYHLELLGRVEIMAFDKTGTITEGKPGVTAVWTTSSQEVDSFLRLAAAVEQRSEHHLGEAVLAEAVRRGLDVPPVRDFENHTGLGVHGRVEGQWVGIGREGLFELHDVPIPPEVLMSARHFREQGQTALLGVVEEEGGGVIALADRPRADAAAALATLKQIGIRRNVILTGDHEGVAQAVAQAVGADEVRAGLLPDQKVLELRSLMEDGRPLAMVGDGVNDAPALAAAPIGIAMGGAGSDVALEVADVVLMRDDLMSLPFAVWLSRQARRHVRENMALAFGVIGFLVIFSLLGLPLWLGVIGHEGSTLLVVLNGLRLLWETPPVSTSSCNQTPQLTGS
jgi:Cd2+/Zn2+-exporting ATPase